MVAGKQEFGTPKVMILSFIDSSTLPPSPH